MNLLRRTLEILGFGVTTPKGKKVRSSRRLRTFRQARARHLLFEQVEDRRVLATVSAAAMSSTVMEGSPAAVYFNVSPPSMMPITVNYQTVAGTATENMDYQGVTGSTTIYPGQNFASVGINTLTDNVVEPAETFSVMITSVSGATVGTASATITINDNSGGSGGGGGPGAPSGVVSIAALTDHYPEGTPANFRITLSPPQPTSVSVMYQTIAGTAIENTDYTAKSGTVTIPANQSSVDVNVTTLHDFSEEQGETFSLKITSATGANVSTTQNSALATIDDVPFVLPTIAVAGGTLSQNGLFTPTILVDNGTAGNSYTFTVSWGDGSQATYGTSDVPTHTYFDDDPSADASDIYTISVTANWALGPTATSAVAMTINISGGQTSEPLSVPSTLLTGANVYISQGYMNFLAVQVGSPIQAPGSPGMPPPATGPQPHQNTTNDGGSLGSVNEMSPFSLAAIPTGDFSTYYAYKVLWGNGSSGWYFGGDTPTYAFPDDVPVGTHQDEITVSLVRYAWNGTTSTTNYTLTVVNVLPIANVDEAATLENTAIDINVLTNDTDISWADRQTLTVGEDTDLNNLSPTGTVTYLGGGIFRYDPGDKFDWLQLGQEATDTFHYRLYDDDDTTVGTLGTVHVTLTGQREAYTVTFTSSGAMNEDGRVGGTLKLTLSPPAKANGVTVHWSLVNPSSALAVEEPYAATSDDIDDPNDDSDRSSGTETFNFGEFEKTIQIKPHDDTIVEKDEKAYFWMTEPSVTTNAYTLDAGGFATLVIADDEWHWVNYEASGSLPEATVAIYDGSSSTPDSWTRSWFWEAHTSYVLYGAKSKYVSNPNTDDEWQSVTTGAANYSLDSQSGDIMPVTGVSTGSQPSSGPTTAIAGRTDDQFGNFGANKKWVAFKIYVGTGCHGSFAVGISAILSFNKEIPYGDDKRETIQIVLTAQRGNN